MVSENQFNFSYLGQRNSTRAEVIILNGDMNDVNPGRLLPQNCLYAARVGGKNLYHTLSVFENVDFFGRLFGQSNKSEKSASMIYLKVLGWRLFKDRPAGKLSGGMKQKLGLCCALIHDPQLLILDEPTTGLTHYHGRNFGVN